MIAREELDAALIAIHRLIDQVFFEPLNTARIFSSSLLDKFCQEIGEINWRRVCAEGKANRQAAQFAPENERPVVYLVSKLHASGGHTSALADVIRLGPAARSVVLVTGIVGKTDAAALQHRFRDMPGVTFEFASKGGHLQKLTWLQQRLLALEPRTVWLFNHHQDSVAIAAVQPECGYRVRYYHHGDHQICLGVHLPFAEHIDPHPMGFHFCRDHLGIRNNRYLPLVAKDLGAREEPARGGESGIVTCTSGSSNKVEVPYFIRYADVVPQLIQAGKGKHIHIGRLSPITLLRISRGLRRLGLPESAFVNIPYVPSVWKALHEHQVDLYIASFPFGGGKTLIEAMGAGVPVTLHRHSFSRLLCTYDMAPDSALRWRYPNELCAYIASLDQEEIRRQGRLARFWYEKYYSEELLRKGLADRGPELLAPPLCGGFVEDRLQDAIDTFTHVSWRGLAWRLLIQVYRGIKSLKV